MGNPGPMPNMGSMGMPPQYSRMPMSASGIQPITSQRRPSTLQYQPAPQNQAPMPGNPVAGNRFIPMCDAPGMQGPMQGPIDQKPVIDPMGPLGHMGPMGPIGPIKPGMNSCNSPMMDIKPQISESSYSILCFYSILFIYLGAPFSFDFMVFIQGRCST